MQPIKTAETNFNFGPPINVIDGSIGDLPCARVDEGMGMFVFSVWEPTPEEREAIAYGHNVRLRVGWIGSFPPVSLGITHLTKVDDNAEG